MRTPILGGIRKQAVYIPFITPLIGQVMLRNVNPSSSYDSAFGSPTSDYRQAAPLAAKFGLDKKGIQSAFKAKGRGAGLGNVRDVKALYNPRTKTFMARGLFKGTPDHDKLWNVFQQFHTHKDPATGKLRMWDNYDFKTNPGEAKWHLNKTVKDVKKLLGSKNRLDAKMNLSSMRGNAKSLPLLPIRNIVDSLSNKTVWEASHSKATIDEISHYVKAPASRVRWARPGTAKVTGKIADGLQSLIKLLRKSRR